MPPALVLFRPVVSLSLADRSRAFRMTRLERLENFCSSTESRVEQVHELLLPSSSAAGWVRATPRFGRTVIIIIIIIMIIAASSPCDDFVIYVCFVINRIASYASLLAGLCHVGRETENTTCDASASKKSDTYNL